MHRSAFNCDSNFEKAFFKVKQQRDPSGIQDSTNIFLHYVIVALVVLLKYFKYKYVNKNIQQIKNKNPVKAFRTWFLITLSFFRKLSTIFSHIVWASLGKFVLMGKRTTLLLDIEPVENCAECTFVEPVKKRSYVKCTNSKVDILSF